MSEQAPKAPRTPRAIAHVGLTIPDLDAAIAWYADVLGLVLISPPGEVVAGEGRFGELCADVFGPRFDRLRIAHMAGANGATIELFQFLDPAYEAPTDNFEYWKGGFSHICVIDPDIEGLAQRIETNGGRIRTSRIWTLFEGLPYKMSYCQDPWGSIIEIYSHSHEQTYANH
jgi:catechol 2,3-dioxygenase-like lactoylglutathione lyase family enzyme